jgi:hypothetical protein
MTAIDVDINLRIPHGKQRDFLDCTAKRIVIRAGRRSGKTTGIAIKAVEEFIKGRRVLYAAPTDEQVDTFWWEIKQALQEAIDVGAYKKNEVKHIIEVPETKNRIRAKTAWNADTLRGDYGDLLILDEWQLMNEQAWNRVGAPMLMDNNGDAIFIYTPPSTRTRSVSKARDKLHAAKLYKKAEADTSGRYQTFHFTSFDNPHISNEAVFEVSQDMSNLAYRQEIMAEDIDEIPGALWTRANIEQHRRDRHPDLARIVVAIDPAVTSGETSDETGIVVCGCDNDRDFKRGYMLEDGSMKDKPIKWALRAIGLYYKWNADAIVAEANNGGDLVTRNIQVEDDKVPVKLVWASRGKRTRAEPISTLSDKGQISHVGSFSELEDEMCTWLPGDKSPNRMDAYVWGFTELMLGQRWQVVA